MKVHIYKDDYQGIKDLSKLHGIEIQELVNAIFSNHIDYGIEKREGKKPKLNGRKVFALYKPYLSSEVEKPVRDYAKNVLKRFYWEYVTLLFRAHYKREISLKLGEYTLVCRNSLDAMQMAMGGEFYIHNSEFKTPIIARLLIVGKAFSVFYDQPRQKRNEAAEKFIRVNQSQVIKFMISRLNHKKRDAGIEIALHYHGISEPDEVWQYLREFDRVKGEFGFKLNLANDSATCNGCKVRVGRLHDLTCDLELCPFCRGQLITCDCRYSKLGFDPDNLPKDIYEGGLPVNLIQDWLAILDAKGRLPYGA
ncbi:MAG: hypothetical protein GY928_33785 [Colwellia sp.]|nr:hypothetical protein [Colwellia sp.]